MDDLMIYENGYEYCLEVEEAIKRGKVDFDKSMFDEFFEDQWLDSQEIVERDGWLFLVQRFTPADSDSLVTMVQFTSSTDPNIHIDRDKRRAIARDIYKEVAGYESSGISGFGVT